MTPEPADGDLGSMAALSVVDRSRAGHELSRARLTDLPARLTLRELLRRRIHGEVATYNAAPGAVYRGLVQPEDAIRHSDGFRMRAPRALDADRFVTAVEEAAAAGMLRVRVGADETAELAVEVTVADHDELTIVLERPVVARTP